MNLKKPRFWDYKKPNFVSYSLWPITILVKILFVLKSKKKIKFKKIKTICVGNIYIGGTGKTPSCLLLKTILERLDIKSCFIKKNYSNQIDEQNLLSKYGDLFVEKIRLSALIK